MNETISNLITFQIVAKNASFRKAASALKTSPATISRRITELEGTLGVQLLVRTTRKVYLTDVGKQLLKDSQAALRQLEYATRRAANSSDHMAGLVRIATTYTSAETLILPLIPQIYENEPTIRIELLLNEAVIDIRDQNIDFAIRFGHLADPTLIARRIGSDQISYYCAAEAGPNPPLLSYGNKDLEPSKPVLRVSDMRMLLDLLSRGFGGAWLPKTLVASAKTTGLICDLSKPSFSFDAYIVYHANRFIPRRTRYVMDQIIEAKILHL